MQQTKDIVELFTTKNFEDFAGFQEQAELYDKFPVFKDFWMNDFEFNGNCLQKMNGIEQNELGLFSLGTLSSLKGLNPISSWPTS